MSRYREFGWSKNSSKSYVDLDVMEEDMQELLFYRAQKGPIVEPNQQIL